MKSLDELIAKRDKFLKENPHMVPYQQAIDQQTEGMTPMEKTAWCLTHAARKMQEMAGHLQKL